MHINRRPSWFLGDLDLWPQFHVSRSNQHPQKPRTRHQNKDSSYKGWEVMIISVWAKTQKAAIFNLCNFEVTHPRREGLKTSFQFGGFPGTKLARRRLGLEGAVNSTEGTVLWVFTIFLDTFFIFIREINPFWWDKYKNLCFVIYLSI